MGNDDPRRFRLGSAAVPENVFMGYDNDDVDDVRCALLPPWSLHQQHSRARSQAWARTHVVSMTAQATSLQTRACAQAGRVFLMEASASCTSARASTSAASSGQGARGAAMSATTASATPSRTRAPVTLATSAQRASP